MIGAWIVEFEQKGQDRAKYGERLISEIAKATKIKGLGTANLHACRNFYRNYPQIFQTLSGEFGKKLNLDQLGAAETMQSLPARINDTQIHLPSEQILSHLAFSHIVELLKIDDPLQRAFYEIETIKSNWSVRELKRQIGSLLFERMGLSRDKQKLMEIVQGKSETLAPKHVIRDPYVFEFIGLRDKEVMEESDLEHALLDHLQAFLLELGRGFCFEARQMRLQIGSEYFDVDLVFYHRILKCHVLLDLKLGNFDHGHAGQHNTYLNYFRQNLMQDGDNPPIGILLCSGKDEPLVEYALGGLDQQLFVSKYQLQLPKVDELREFVQNDYRKLAKTLTPSP